MTTYFVVVGGEGESLLSGGGRCWWCYWLEALGNIGQYGLGRILKKRAGAVGVGIVRDVVFSFCLVTDRS